ncbi:MAG: ABC transporter ATP-binding protein [Oscillospiraceae bacterium]
MIEVMNVTKSFDGFKALDELTMHVPRGAIYGLVGPNGSGKSTIIRHICGVYRPDSGKILVDGAPVYENTDVKARMFVIPDDSYYFMQSSINDMMKFYRGVYPNFDMERFNKLREVFTLDTKQPIRKMSKGMQKQAAFWLAICLRPEVLILDEPVDGLDPVMRRQVWGLLMSDVAERNETVLVASHNLRELEDVCDHVGILSHGRVLLERSLTELQDNIKKLQFVPGDTGAMPEGLNILHAQAAGKMHTLIVRGCSEEILNRAAAVNPVYFEELPLTLEEIFIYELGGADYAVKDIIL